MGAWIYEKAVLVQVLFLLDQLQTLTEEVHVVVRDGVVDSAEALVDSLLIVTFLELIA